MYRFEVTLHPTYYAQGFFNVRVDHDGHIGPEGPVEIRVGPAQSVIHGKVDRRANRNGTARVLGRAALRDAFQRDWSQGDAITVEVVAPNVLRLDFV